MASTDACARWLEPNASLTYALASAASSAANAGSFFSSSGWKRRFSSSTTLPPAAARSTAAFADGPTQSSANSTGRPSSSARRAATGRSVYSRFTLPFGRPRCEARITVAPCSSA